jgi:tetratricopeptide (TPR) repeat protein
LVLVVPISRRLDAGLLRALEPLRLGWTETIVRERQAILLARGGDVRGAARIQRRGVERAVERKGDFDLAVAISDYGVLLLATGWVGQAVGYLTVAARMTHRWPSGLLRDQVLLFLAGAHAFRGELDAAAAILAAAPTRGSFAAISARAGAAWSARLLDVRAFLQLFGGDSEAAVVTWRAALDAAHRAVNRDLIVAVNNNLAGALITLASYADAESRIAVAETLVPPKSPIRANLFGTRAELEIARGELVAARESLNRSQALKAQLGIEGGIGWTMATRARLEAAAGNRQQAKRLLDEAAGNLQDLGALHAWRLAAVAIGDSQTRIELAPAAPDPLLEAARAVARELPVAVFVAHRAMVWGIGFALVLPVFWFALRLHDRVFGGWTTVFLALGLLAVLLFAWTFIKRVPRR